MTSTPSTRPTVSTSHDAPILMGFTADLPNHEAVEDRRGWVRYGEDDDFPDYLYEVYRASPTHHALCNGIADMAYGQGVTAQTEDLQAASRVEAIMRASAKYESGRHLVRKLYRDLKVYGRAYLEVIYGQLGGPVVELHHVPFRFVRAGVRDEDGNITSWWHSIDWSATNKKRNKPEERPAWRPGVSGIVAVELFGSEDAYYPPPDYVGALGYAALEMKVAEFHLANIENGLFPSFHIHHNNGIPDERTRADIRTEYERRLAGSGNAGAFILTFSDGADRKTELTPIPVNDADKQYQFLSTEATAKIMIGHRVTSPLLFGIRDGGGLGSNTDEMATAMDLLERNVLQGYREAVCDALSEVLEVKVVAVPASSPIAPQEGAENVAMSAIKVTDGRPILAADEAEEVLAHLRAHGQPIEELLEDYRIIDEEYVDDTPPTDYELSKQYAFTINGRPSDPSSFDKGFYRIRYQYRPGEGQPDVIPTSRTFCRTMMGEFRTTVFRKEDVDVMSFSRANPEFGTYSIWRFKGSYNCRHRWKRLVFFLKRVPAGKQVTIDGVTYKGGQFLPATSIEHYRVLTPSDKEYGPRPKPNDREATTVNPKPKR